MFGDDRGKDVAIAGLKSKAKYVRSELGKRMKLRLTPEVRFIEDESMERGSRVRLLIYLSLQTNYIQAFYAIFSYYMKVLMILVKIYSLLSFVEQLVYIVN